MHGLFVEYVKVKEICLFDYVLRSVHLLPAHSNKVKQSPLIDRRLTVLENFVTHPRFICRV